MGSFWQTAPKLSRFASRTMVTARHGSESCSSKPRTADLPTVLLSMPIVRATTRTTTTTTATMAPLRRRGCIMRAIVALASHLDIEACVFQNLPDSAGSKEGDAIAIISDDPEIPAMRRRIFLILSSFHRSGSAYEILVCSCRGLLLPRIITAITTTLTCTARAHRSRWSGTTLSRL